MRRMSNEEKQKVFDKLRRVLQQGRGDDATEDVYGPPPVSTDTTDDEADRRAIEAVYGPPNVFKDPYEDIAEDGDEDGEEVHGQTLQFLYGPPPFLRANEDEAIEDVYGPPPCDPEPDDEAYEDARMHEVYGPPSVFGDVTEEADDMRPAEGLYGPPPAMSPMPIGTEGRRNAQRLYGPMPVARPVDDDSEAGGNDMDGRTDTKAQALEVAMAFGYADIEYVMEWQGYAVFSPVESGGDEGLPEFILATDTFARMTMGDEAFQIMDEMPEDLF